MTEDLICFKCQKEIISIGKVLVVNPNYFKLNLKIAYHLCEDCYLEIKPLVVEANRRACL